MMRLLLWLCEPFPKFWNGNLSAAREEGRTGWLSVRLKFAVPITGPIILGYTAHYGLGAMTLREWVGVAGEIVQ